MRATKPKPNKKEDSTTMATTEIVNLTDDLDGTTDNVHTVSFTNPTTGDKVELELSEKNAKALNKVIAGLDKYLAVARIVEATKPSNAAPKADTEQAKIRAWAKANGFQIGDRGRIKADIVAAYNSAQSAVANPDTDAQAAGDEPVSVPTEGFSTDEESGKLLDEATASVELDGETQVVDNGPGSQEATNGTDEAWQGDGPSDAELLELMREVEAEKGEVTLEDLAAKVAENE